MSCVLDVVSLPNLVELERSKLDTSESLPSRLLRLYDLIIPQLHNLLSSHDGIRFLQLLFRYGDTSIHKHIFMDLVPYLSTIVLRDHSRQLLLSIINDLSKQTFAELVMQFRGRFSLLLLNPMDLRIMDALWYRANHQQRSVILSELYAPNRRETIQSFQQFSKIQYVREATEHRLGHRSNGQK
jgi:hypothetical protein